MTDKAKQKSLVEAAKSYSGDDKWLSREALHASFDARDAEFIAAASPAEVLALIAENDHLALCARQWEEAAMQWSAERDQLKAENERLRADYASLSTFNPDWDRVAAAQDSVREHVAVAAQLKAENEALRKDSKQMAAAIAGAREFILSDANVRHMLDKTGEVSSLFPRRKAILALLNAVANWSVESDLETLNELAFVHKDAERYRFIADKACDVSFCVSITDYGDGDTTPGPRAEILPDQFPVETFGSGKPKLDWAIDAAMSKGERS